MNKNNDNGAGLFALVAALILFGMAISLAKSTGVPTSIALTAVLGFILWLGFFIGALYVRFRMREDLIDYIWPFFMLGLWMILIPFLDHWASPARTLSFAQSDPAFYGTVLFQGSVGLLILISGYAAIFRLKSHR
ncbi:hypothetical protein [Vibrio campbellii]|uniref:hypothetical protein n=1 Tax=Vibrio campbellii TaxID=680 RepID=UPI000CD3536F|nr:hypothetical protein [Vibrio campbellii]AUW07625.1 hypothetical protein C1N51_28820 [Vibrio campbellii]